MLTPYQQCVKEYKHRCGKRRDGLDAFMYAVDELSRTYVPKYNYALITQMASRTVEPLLQIDKVIFNNPATIIIWKDGTKTVVKAQGREKFDKEKGLAMAICKKIYGNKGSYCNVFKTFIDEPDQSSENKKNAVKAKSGPKKRGVK